MISELILGFLIKKGYKTQIGEITINDINVLTGQIDAIYSDYYDVKMLQNKD